MKLVYAITADDPILRRDSVKSIVNTLVTPDDYIFDVKKLNADGTPAFDIITALENYPIGEGTRVVIVEDAQKISTKDAGRIEAALDSLPDTSCLILVVDTSDGSKLCKKLKNAVARKNGLYQVGGTTKRARISVAMNYVNSLLKNAGINLPASIVSSIINRVGNAPLVLKNEVTKVIDYGVFTEEALDAVLSPGKDDQAFAMVDALCLKDVQQAITLARQVITTDEKSPTSGALRLLSLMERQYALVMQAKTLQEFYGINLEDGVPDSLLPLMHEKYNLSDALKRNPWQARRITVQAKRLTWNDISSGFITIRKAGDRIKAGDKIFDDPELVISFTVMRMCGSDE